MKFTIRYRLSGVDPVAETTIRGSYIVAIGESWAEARQRLISKIQVFKNQPTEIPQPEEVEL